MSHKPICRASHNYQSSVTLHALSVLLLGKLIFPPPSICLLNHSRVCVWGGLGEDNLTTLDGECLQYMVTVMWGRDAVRWLLFSWLQCTVFPVTDMVVCRSFVTKAWYLVYVYLLQGCPPHTDRGEAIGCTDKRVPEGAAARTETKEDGPPTRPPQVE